MRPRLEEAGVYLEPIRTIKFFIMVYEMARQPVDDVRDRVCVLIRIPTRSQIATAIDPLLFAMHFDLAH